MAKQLAEEAGKLAECIRYLARATDGPGRQSLANHKAFVMLHTWKGALVAGLEKGGGALIRVIRAEDGTVRLSAPLFLSTHKFAFGVSVGVSHCHSCITLDRESDIEAFSKPEATFGKEIDIPTYARSVKDRNQGFHKNDTLPAGVDTKSKDGLGPHIFSASDSYMLVDFSLAGGVISPDAELNKIAYGEQHKAQDILSGSVAVPAEMEMLYEYIKQKFIM